MAEKDTVTEEQTRYRDYPTADDLKDTAKKIPADKSEQKVTTSTEGSVEKTTERTGDRG